MTSLWQVDPTLERWMSFQNLCSHFNTIPIRMSFFTTFDKIISNFIWNKKRPRIRLFCSGQNQMEGWDYSCSLILGSVWKAGRGSFLGTDHSCGLTSLNALLFSPMPLSLHYVRNNPIVSQPLKIWCGMRKLFGCHSGSLLAPVYPNHLFSPSVMDDSFEVWKRSGIINMKALFIDKTFPTFRQLQRKLNFPQSHLFKFFQWQLC